MSGSTRLFCATVKSTLSEQKESCLELSERALALQGRLKSAIQSEPSQKQGTPNAFLQNKEYQLETLDTIVEQCQLLNEVLRGGRARANQTTLSGLLTNSEQQTLMEATKFNNLSNLKLKKFTKN